MHKLQLSIQVSLKFWMMFPHMHFCLLVTEFDYGETR
jgi:hypothetical protein